MIDTRIEEFVLRILNTLTPLVRHKNSWYRRPAIALFGPPLILFAWACIVVAGILRANRELVDNFWGAWRLFKGVE